jgi:hypothetical protein
MGSGVEKRSDRKLVGWATVECINQEKMGKPFDIHKPFSIFSRYLNDTTDPPCPAWLDRHTNDISKW